MTDRPFLTPQDQHSLIDSAIAADIAAERPYMSVTADDPKLAAFADYQRTSGILIAVRPPDGSNNRYQLRRDQERIRADGSRAKYEQPAGGEHRLDVHPRFHDKLSDPTVPLWIGEGIKKGDALASRGQACVSLGGVECGLTPACLGDWRHIAIEGRTFLICFDYDPKPVTRQNVTRAQNKIAAFLTERGGRVRIVSLPHGPNGTKVGIDDFLASGGNLVALVAEHCQDWRPPTDGDCHRDDCRATREQFRLQTHILTAPGIQANRRLPSMILLNRLQSDSTRQRHPLSEPGKPETWNYAEPLADAQGFVGVNLQRVAKETAVPYGALLRSRKELVALGVLEAREEPSIVPNPKDPDRHIEITRTLIRPAGGVRTPREIVARLVTIVPAPSSWGGKRVRRCRDHPDATIITKHVCSECGRAAETVVVTDFKLETGPDATHADADPTPISSLKQETATEVQDEPQPGSVSLSPPRTSSADLANGSAVLLQPAIPPDAATQHRLQREARAEVDELVARRTLPPVSSLKQEAAETACPSDFKLETPSPEADVGYDPPPNGGRSPWPMQFLMQGAGMRWQSYVVCGLHIRQGQRHWEQFAAEHPDALPRVVEELRQLRQSSDWMTL
jgi:hypothetical protein